MSLLKLKLQIFEDLFAYIKYFYYLCGGKRLFKNLINNVSINQTNVKVMKRFARPNRGTASAGPKKPGNPSGRTQYGGGGRRGCYV